MARREDRRGVALFAIYCFADAITQVIGLFRSGESTGHRALTILLALLDVAAGLVAVAYPGITAGALVILVGVTLLVAAAVAPKGADIDEAIA